MKITEQLIFVSALLLSAKLKVESLLFLFFAEFGFIFVSVQPLLPFSIIVLHQPK